eukprot:Skav218145  [mRNA]  locus=scaffold759:556089:574444:+ [translate_table: standard]
MRSLQTVEQKRLLSFLEENRLLSALDRTWLSTLEQTGLLSQVESLAAQRFGGVPFGLGGEVRGKASSANPSPVLQAQELCHLGCRCVCGGVFAQRLAAGIAAGIAWVGSDCDRRGHWTRQTSSEDRDLFKCLGRDMETETEHFPSCETLRPIRSQDLSPVITLLLPSEAKFQAELCAKETLFLCKHESEEQWHSVHCVDFEYEISQLNEAECFTEMSSVGGLHPVIWALAAVIAMQLLAQSLTALHLWRYSYNGIGVKTIEATSEVMFILSQLVQSTLLILIGYGYALVPVDVEPGTVLLIFSLSAVIHIILVLLTKVEDSADKFHDYDGLAGKMLLGFRLAAFAIFLGLRTLLVKFGFIGTLYFVGHPFLVLLSSVFAPYWRPPLLNPCLAALQIGTAWWLHKLFLSRGEFFEVSELNASSLPGGTPRSPVDSPKRFSPKRFPKLGGPVRGSDQHFSEDTRGGGFVLPRHRAVHNHNAAAAQVDAIPEKGRAAWERKVNRLEEDVSVIQSAVDKQLGTFYRGLAKENRALRDSASALDEVLEQAGSILGNLVNQNKVLKNARRKLLDAASSFGVLDSDRWDSGDLGACFVSRGVTEPCECHRSQTNWRQMAGALLDLNVALALDTEDSQKTAMSMMSLRIQPDIVSCNSLLGTFAKTQRWLKACGFFSLLSAKNWQPNTISCSSAAAGCEKANQWTTALWFLSKPGDIVACTTAINACGQGPQSATNPLQAQRCLNVLCCDLADLLLSSLKAH